MIREFAVDPQLLSNFQNFRLLSDKFSFFEARVISEFPKSWVRKVYDALSEVPETQEKIEIMTWIAEAKKSNQVFVKSGRTYQSDKKWIENAIDSEKKFHGILTSESHNFGNLDYIITFNDMTLLNKYPNFKCPVRVLMQRTEQGFKDVAEGLLKYSTNIIFVDPYFFSSHANQSAFGKNLKNLLSLIEKPDKIKYCTGLSPSGQTEDARINDLKKNLPKYLPKNIELKVVLLKKIQGMDSHNRYILTEHGGINFAAGLDLKEDGAKDHVSLLSEDEWKEKYKEFNLLEAYDKPIIITFP